MPASKYILIGEVTLHGYCMPPLGNCIFHTWYKGSTAYMLDQCVPSMPMVILLLTLLLQRWLQLHTSQTVTTPAALLQCGFF